MTYPDYQKTNRGVTVRKEFPQPATPSALLLEKSACIGGPIGLHSASRFPPLKIAAIQFKTIQFREVAPFAQKANQQSAMHNSAQFRTTAKSHFARRLAKPHQAVHQLALNE